MVLIMWQNDTTGVVRFIDKCLERILYTSARSVISPEMAGKDVMDLSLYMCFASSVFLLADTIGIHGHHVAT